MSKSVTVFSLFLSLFICLGIYAHAIERIETPHDFLWGVALSEYQNSGAACCSDSNWSNWEKFLAEKSGNACDFWHNYADDITLMKQLGINSLRFSVEWCVIEPKEGKFSKAALNHYKEVCNALINAGITPMITLHHFVHPQWFEEKGGFEKRKNIKYFERFCVVVFKHLGDCVSLWCTINEPTIYAFQGYIRGVFPPGKTGRFPSAFRVLCNMLEAHTRVYHSLKALPHGDKAQVGFVHQYLVFQPYTSWNPLERIPGLLFNNLLNKSVLHFLKTGAFKVGIPILGSITYQAPPEKPIMDFIGLNYYSRALIKAQLSLTEPLIATHYPDEVMTDMPYAMYSQGLYKAIKDINQLKLPIYITENGIADANDDRRETFLREYLSAMGKAIAEGCDVRGYYYWLLMDNYEWDMGYSMKFGLYAVNRKTQERFLRPSAHYYKTIIKQTGDLA